MAYTPYGWQNPYYAPPMPDNLMQMRQQQMQPMTPQMPQAPQNPVAQSGVQWVAGEQEARNWMIAPNAAVALWDSTPPAAPQAKAVDFVTREEFDRLAAIVGEIRGKEKPTKKVKEADADG